MRALICVGAFMFAWPAAAAPFGWRDYDPENPAPVAEKYNPRKCEAYLLAPKGIKVATADLLTENVTAEVYQKRREQLKAFVDKAPLASDNVVKYLIALRHDSLETNEGSVMDWAEYLTNRYLIRPGNGSLAMKNLDLMFEAFWMDFLFGTSRPRGTERIDQGFAWADTQLGFFVDLARAHSGELRKHWLRSFREVMPELISIDAVLSDFKKAEAYLEAYIKQSDAEVAEDDEFYANNENVDEIVENRERLAYVHAILLELEIALPSQDIETLMKLEHLNVTGNGTYTADVNNWRGTELEFVEPDRALVFLVRLTRRTGFAPPAIQELENTIHRLGRLFPKYPRRGTALPFIRASGEKG